MDMKLELVAIPVSDVDRAKAFYVDQVGFTADHDAQVSDELRFVQLTPPGSDAVTHRLVEVDMEAHLVGIEVACPVHVGDGHGDELQSHVQLMISLSALRQCRRP